VRVNLDNVEGKARADVKGLFADEPGAVLSGDVAEDEWEGGRVLASLRQRGSRLRGDNNRFLATRFGAIDADVEDIDDLGDVGGDQRMVLVVACSGPEGDGEERCPLLRDQGFGAIDADVEGIDDLGDVGGDQRMVLVVACSGPEGDGEERCPLLRDQGFDLAEGRYECTDDRR
jgi:hypothetical protein